MEIDLLKKIDEYSRRMRKSNGFIVTGRNMAVKKGCEIMNISTSVFYYKPKKSRAVRDFNDAQLRDEIEAIQEEFPCAGYERFRPICSAGSDIGITGRRSVA